jgi:hypothetical protein
MMRWNREAAMLGIPDLPEEGFKHVGDRKIKPQGGGGGGHTTSTGTQYTSSVPEWLKGEQKDIVARGMALAQSPYRPYTGERISQFTPMQRQAFSAAERQQVAPQIGQATGLTGLATMGAMGAQFDPYQTGQFTAQTAAQYMDPFMQNVVGIQQQAAQRQADIAATQRGSQAVRTGAFGGSRQAIENAEANRALASQMGDIQARGLQDSFARAQEMFNREQQMQEQSRQFGAGFGMQGLELGMRGAGQLGQLGQQQFGQEMDIMGRQREYGDLQQQQVQRILDQRFSDFQAQRDFPYQQLGFASDLIQGRGGSTRSMYQQPTASPLQTAAGLGGIAAGLGGMFAKGGEVQGYANGGVTGLLGDQELEQRAQDPMTSPMGQMAAQDQMAQNAMLRAAAPQGLPQPMVEDTIDAVEAGMIIEMQKAMNEGDRQRAEALAETIERRRAERMAQEEMGVAAAAADEMGDIPGGGITGMPTMMAMGGEVQRFFRGGDTPYTRSRDEQLLAELMPDPDAESAAGRALRDAGRAVKRGFLYSSDAEALRAAGRLPEASDVAAPASAAPAGIEALAPEAEVETNRQKRAVMDAVNVAEAAAAAQQKADQTAPGAMEQGIAAAVPMAFDPVKARAAQEKTIREGEAAALGDVDKEEARYDEFLKGLGLRGEAEEKRVRESLDSIKGEKNKAGYMALFQAGLEILSADPSRGALAAIGQGAIKGLGAYKGDLKDLEERRERMMDKLDTLDGLRRQEAIASEEGRRRIGQRRSQIRTEFGKEYRDMAKQFDIDIPLDAAKTLADQTFRAKERQLDRVALAERGAGTADDKRITAAEAAFQRDPEVKLLLEEAKKPILNSADRQTILERLNEIQTSKYKQFGVTMVEPPADAGASGFTVRGSKPKQ